MTAAAAVFLGLERCTSDVSSATTETATLVRFPQMLDYSASTSPVSETHTPAVTTRWYSGANQREPVQKGNEDR